MARELAAPGGYPPPLDGGVEEVERSVTMLGVARELAGAPGLRVRDRAVVSRLRTQSDRVVAIEARDADGDHREIRANEVVLATHGIENAALLLRSGLHGPAVGRWLGDHTHIILDLELAEPADHWPAATRDSGISYAWLDGPWRSERASAVVVPFNPGLFLRDTLLEPLADGEAGEPLRRRLADRFARTEIGRAHV